MSIEKGSIILNVDEKQNCFFSALFLLKRIAYRSQFMNYTLDLFNNLPVITAFFKGQVNL
ncbi:hypothetical protein D3C80_2045970 [compost metagenome]